MADEVIARESLLSKSLEDLIAERDKDRKSKQSPRGGSGPVRERKRQSSGGGGGGGGSPYAATKLREAAPDRNCRVYVGNVPGDISVKSMEGVVGRLGFKGTGYHVDMANGYAIVSFPDAATAARFIKDGQGADIDGQRVVVRPDHGGGGGGGAPSSLPYSSSRAIVVEKQHASADDGCSIYVGNLPWDIKDGELSGIFAECGRIVSCRIITNRDGRSAGWGVVAFSKPGAAERAIHSFNDAKVNDRPINVRLYNKD